MFEDLASDSGRIVAKTAGSRTGALLHRGAPLVVVAVAGLLLPAWLYRLWEGHVGIPWMYSGDVFQNAMMIKAVVHDGEFWDIAQLGAPFAQHFQDWPFTDVLPFILGKVLSVFTGNWAALLNVIYLLTFPFVALSAWWVMRQLGVSRWVACALSLVYAVAPYHFWRSELHLLLSGYYGVPLGVWLAMLFLDGTSPFGTRSEARWWCRYATWRSLRVVAIAAVIALSSVYYMAFTGVLLVAVTLVNVVRRRWGTILPAMVVLGLMGAAFLASATPTLLYRAQYGPNVLAGERPASDTETYALKVTQMVLPARGHPIDALAAVRARYVEEFPVPSEHSMTALGLVATVGFAWLVLQALVAVAAGRRPVADRRHGHLAFLTLVLVLTGTVGGVATLVSLLLTSQLRAWNRVSIVIAFLALTALGLLIDQLAKRWSVLARPLVAGPLLTVLVVGAALDQYSPDIRFQYATNRQAFLDDADFFSRVEASLPEGASVFQLPVTPFPAPVQAVYVDMDAYAPMRGYLHTDHLHWSYGGIEGRVEYEWQRRLTGMPVPELIESLVAVGFRAISIDRFGYLDRAAALEAEIERVTGTSPLVSRDERMSLHDLGSHADRLRATRPDELDSLRRDLLFPVTSQVVGFDYRLQDENGTLASWAPEDPVIPIVNESDRPLSTVMSFQLVSGDGRPANFTIIWPDGNRSTVTVDGEPVSVSHGFVAAPGPSEVRVDSDAAAVVAPGDPRDLHFRIRALDVSPGP